MGLAKVAIQCSADTFVVNQSLILRINNQGLNAKIILCTLKVNIGITTRAVLRQASNLN
jgi:hypothetical protein